MLRHLFCNVIVYCCILSQAPHLFAQADRPLTTDELKAGLISEKLPGVTIGEAGLQRPLPPERQNLLDKSFTKVFAASKATGLSACVYLPNEGLWAAAVGVEDRLTNKPLTITSRFHAGSIGKMITAVLILQLIEEKWITRETKLSRWLPEIKGSDKITVDHLLSHTSGLPGNLLQENPAKLVPMRERVYEAAQQGLSFQPGRGFSYSNPGYMSLGLILEQEYGMPLAEIIETHFIRRYGLDQSKAITSANRDNVLINSSHQGKPGKESIDYSSVGGAGSLASTPSDLVRILNRLLAGEVLKPETTSLMLSRMYPMQKQGQLYWGRGLMVIDMPLGRMYYLAGRIKGFGAMAGYFPKGDVFVSVMVNDDTQIEPVMFALIKSLQQVK